MQEPLVKTHVQGSQYQFFQVLSPVTSMANGQVSFPRGRLQLKVYSTSTWTKWRHKCDLSDWKDKSGSSDLNLDFEMFFILLSSLVLIILIKWGFERKAKFHILANYGYNVGQTIESHLQKTIHSLKSRCPQSTTYLATSTRLPRTTLVLCLTGLKGFHSIPFFCNIFFWGSSSWSLNSITCSQYWLLFLNHEDIADFCINYLRVYHSAFLYFCAYLSAGTANQLVIKVERWDHISRFFLFHHKGYQEVFKTPVKDSVRQLGNPHPVVPVRGEEGY